MAQIPQGDPILLHDLPNDAMYVSRQWFEYMQWESRKLSSLRATLRALLRDFPESVPAEEIEKLGLTQ